MKEPALVDLGTDFVPKDVGCGSFSCCCVSTVGTLKCWGFNGQGQLGYGDTNNRGDESGEMGDNLQLVQLPTGFVVEQLAFLAYATCVVSTDDVVVCWGWNKAGELGIGQSNWATGDG